MISTNEAEVLSPLSFCGVSLEDVEHCFFVEGCHIEFVGKLVVSLGWRGMGILWWLYSTIGTRRVMKGWEKSWFVHGGR